MKRLRLFFPILLIIGSMTLLSGQITAQPSVDQPEYAFQFLPQGLNFPALKANVQEARIGVFKFLDQSNMKVDIGNTIDLFGYSRNDSGVQITAGIDFMGYALTTGANGLRLQIDALDGFFGGNIATAKSIREETGRETGVWRGRLRLLHHSAHLVDGHFDKVTKTWMGNRTPIPFTRDFGELVLSRESPRRQEPMNFRIYGGLSYATLVRPVDINRWEYLIGAEIYSPLFLPSILGRPANIYTAANTSLLGAPTYQATNQIQAGIKFGDWYGKGPAIFLAYYSGRQMFAEYYDVTVSTLAAGFTADF